MSSQASHRGRPPTPVPETWKVMIMRLIGEQHAVRLDQLGRFLGSDEDSAQRVADQLCRDGLAKCGLIFHGEGSWIWLTRRGMRFTGLGLEGKDPRVGAMKRIRALNEIRLQIASRAPQARWICGRVVKQRLGRYGHQPAAVVEIGAERHAIVLAPGRKLYAEAASAVMTHSARYDAVVYFCDPAPRRALRRLSENYHWPKLVIRDIPRAPGVEGTAISGPTDLDRDDGGPVVLTSAAEYRQVAEASGPNPGSRSS